MNDNEEYIEEYYNKHYIRIDEENRIIHGFSDAFGQPQDGDICINDKGGYQFRLVIADGLSEENPPLRDDYGVLLYRWDGEYAVRRSDEELEADRPEPGEPPPTAIELVTAFLEGAGYEAD